MRHGEHAQIERGIDEPARLVARHVDAELLEQPEDGAGLGRSRRVVVAGDQHDRRVGQRLAEPLELAKGEDDRGIGRPDRVEQVAGHDDRVGPRLDHAVDGGAKGVGDIGLALVDAGGGLPMVLPDAEMGVGDVGQFHSRNVSPMAD